MEQGRAADPAEQRGRRQPLAQRASDDAHRLPRTPRRTARTDQVRAARMPQAQRIAFDQQPDPDRPGRGTRLISRSPTSDPRMPPAAMHVTAGQPTEPGVSRSLASSTSTAVAAVHARFSSPIRIATSTAPLARLSQQPSAISHHPTVPAGNRGPPAPHRDARSASPGDQDRLAAYAPASNQNEYSAATRTGTPAPRSSPDQRDAAVQPAVRPLQPRRGTTAGIIAWLAERKTISPAFTEQDRVVAARCWRARSRSRRPARPSRRPGTSRS